MAQSGNEISNTHFAITSVNVPDRLDLRDMDDRKQAEDEHRQRRFDSAALRAWFPRMFFLALVVGAAFILFEVIDTWSTTLSATQLSQRLSTALRVPVRVESSQFSISPSPRLVLSKVVIDNQIVLPEVSVSVATKTVAQILQARGWNWGEAVVAPTSLTLEQGRSLLALLHRLDEALPRSLSTLRMERLEILNQPWLAGAWNVSVVRNKDSGFGVATAIQRTDKGTLQVDLTPSAGGAASVDFQLESKSRPLPFLPDFPVEVGIASGTLAPDHVKVDEFSMGGPFGSLHGHLSADFAGAWTLNGIAETEGLDVDALFRLIAPPPTREDDANGDAPSAIQGTAAFSGQFHGSGRSVFAAANAATFLAPVHVRWPILNGVNLGYAATRPGGTGGTGGGTTRFSSLDGEFYAGGGVITLRDIRAHAGALSASGQVSMGAGHALSGLLRVDMGATRVLAPIRVVVHGTLQRPEFGR